VGSQQTGKGAGLIPFCKATKRFLLFFRSEKIGYFPRTWAGVGGKVDDVDGSKYKNSALREMCEETMFCEKIPLRLLYIYREEKFTYRNYIGFVKNEFDCVLNWENEKVKWVTLNEMINHENLHPGFAQMLNDPKAFALLKKYSA
jgi:ADP-ribose pyrophosphatase YjhB (NUDIX family)